MTKRIEKGRHRAATSASSFEILSRAVASNAGAMGRQAAVVAAASGLVVTLGVSGANATKQDQAAAPVENATLNVERTASVKPADIKAEAKAAPIASVKVKATPAPVVEEVEEVEEVDEPAASSESGLTEADFAAQVSADGSTAAATAPATSSTAPKKNSTAPKKNSTAPKKNAEKYTPAPKSASGIAGTALSYKGAPYVWGGNTPSGWDCSGFVRYVYAQNGINIKGRSTHAMLASGQLKRVSNPQPGDLVFQNGNNHVGIYIGGGKIIGAQNPKVGTVIRPANSPYGPLTGYYRVG